MPTVLRRGRLRIVIYPADHKPAHIHAIGPDGEAVFKSQLSCWTERTTEELWTQTARADGCRTANQ